jgi:predicted HTH domain antitoxin
MQIAIELPTDFVNFQGANETRQEITTSYALWLVQQGRVTLSRAAELAGVDLYDFMLTCKRNKVPVIDISRDELIAELSEFGSK